MDTKLAALMCSKYNYAAHVAVTGSRGIWRFRVGANGEEALAPIDYGAAFICQALKGLEAAAMHTDLPMLRTERPRRDLDVIFCAPRRDLLWTPHAGLLGHNQSMSQRPPG